MVDSSWNWLTIFSNKFRTECLKFYWNIQNMEYHVPGHDQPRNYYHALVIIKTVIEAKNGTNKKILCSALMWYILVEQNTVSVGYWLLTWVVQWNYLKLFGAII